MDTIRVAVCDDLPVVREHLVAFLETDPEIVVTGAFCEGAEVLRHLASTRVDVLLTDVRMPGMDGPALARAVRRLPSPPRILYVTSYPGEVKVDDALQGIVVGAITKELAPDDLVCVVKLAMTGTTVVSPAIMARYRPPMSVEDRRADFATDAREAEILSLMCLGRTNEDIARELFLSPSTVKKVIATMCQRAGVSGRTGFVFHILG